MHIPPKAFTKQEVPKTVVKMGDDMESRIQKHLDLKKVSDEARTLGFNNRVAKQKEINVKKPVGSEYWIG